MEKLLYSQLVSLCQKSYFILFLLLLSFVVSNWSLIGTFCYDTLSCPALCKCHPRGGLHSAQGLPENTMLTVQFTNMTSVSECHLNATPLLHRLCLYGNHLQSLSSQVHPSSAHVEPDRKQAEPADAFSHASTCRGRVQAKEIKLKINVLNKQKAGMVAKLTGEHREAQDEWRTNTMSH